MRESGTHHASLGDYFHVVWRRKWILIASVTLVPAVAVSLSKRQPEVYQAQAQVYMSLQNYANELTGTPDSTVYQPIERIAQTQADLARTPTVASRTIRALHLQNRSAAGLLASSSVNPKTGSNFLIFTVADSDPWLAARLATAYARQFAEYGRELETAALRSAREDVQKRIDDRVAQGDKSSVVYENLLKSVDQLATMEALQTRKAHVIKPAQYAQQIEPRPFRNGVFGLALGLFLGVGLAFLLQALDPRVRSSDEISEQTRLPLLARLPEPPRSVRRDGKLVMLERPNSVEAEPFRMLRTNLEFARAEHRARTVMVTSAVEAEGKSTTVANLAVALARAGRRVVLVDADLRRPLLHTFFGLRGPGLTQVARGSASLEEALVAIQIGDDFGTTIGRDNGDGHRNGQARVQGTLQVLPAGPIPQSVDEFFGSDRLTKLVTSLRSRADVVLIDSSPLLVGGDAMALTRTVDAILLVTRLNVVRRPMLRDLRRVLDASPARKLGYVVAGAQLGDGYYGSGGPGAGRMRRARTVVAESVPIVRAGARSLLGAISGPGRSP